MNIGDKVKIVDSDYSFTTYEAMATRLGATNYRYNVVPIGDVTGKVINTREFRGNVFVLIATEDGEYVIEAGGLEVINPKTDLTTITQPFGKLPRETQLVLVGASLDGKVIEYEDNGTYEKVYRGKGELKFYLENTYRTQSTPDNSGEIESIRKEMETLTQRLKLLEK